MVKVARERLKRGEGERETSKGEEEEGCIGHAARGERREGFDSHRGVSSLVIIHLSNRSAITI